jgi:hypothetical protein
MMWTQGCRWRSNPGLGLANAFGVRFANGIGVRFATPSALGSQRLRRSVRNAFGARFANGFGVRFANAFGVRLGWGSRSLQPIEKRPSFLVFYPELW